MKFPLAVIVAVASVFSSAYATAVQRAPAVADKWISVETGITMPGESIPGNTTLEKRYGTEVLTCYNMGTKVDRAPSTSVIDDWCNNRAIGQVVNNGQTIWARYNYGTFTILVSGEAINGCSFKVDGNCNRLLRLPLDGCNTSGENGKQGGYETDLCGQWRYDPGSNGSDY
ncbi:hypothetical protein JR316_0011168 [Psilocybe cubensis]|uniref:Uncharacterized protein n=3 Tax=Psilocybe cubensis TaxID=181762 RepID=A0A8H7XJI7_PSICU|nr:hypothetical protein JR316_0011161 [Psilocybe cubensis]XP_047744874.1 hypothetical protein JR316_0011168 [Psilocybe cubensis]KAH9477242.1 hypothetical protein JR316_0011161 [Psilocybe cubensis]KAH9477249.1 hypothetical protein JR316_0011168 [Psilocybe cubensis]